MQTNQQHTFLKLWGMPLFLFVITIAGLLLAIIGTGIWHGLSWITLSIPVYFTVKHGKAFLSSHAVGEGDQKQKSSQKAKGRRQ
ncbi:MAG: hypothetical protein EAS52_25730 [Parapedobacter sp.]|nr:MAG: hypothetical protein EAS52_25730 [Parapedobacter sp.]